MPEGYDAWWVATQRVVGTVVDGVERVTMSEILAQLPMPPDRADFQIKISETMLRCDWVDNDGHFERPASPTAKASSKSSKPTSSPSRVFAAVQPVAATADFVVLRGVAVAITEPDGQEFVSDCARCVEGLITATEAIERYELAESYWASLADHAPLQRAVREECARRVRSGQRVREDAQMKVIDAPTVLNEILTDKRAPARERIGAAKELRAAAGENQQGANEKFTININLGTAQPVHIEVDNPRPKADPGRTLEYRCEGEAPAPEPPPEPTEDEA
jgi:hypothetical protein